MAASAPAILFWFYRDAELCENRLRMLRRFNPGYSVFGLYGGDPESAGTYERQLGSLLDDFYAYPGPEDGAWKWINGDLVIRAWYVERGQELSWSSVVIVQWDMLVLGPLSRLVGRPTEDDVVLSGLRPVSEVEGWWPWVSGASRPAFETFMLRLREDGYRVDQAWCCQFVVVCLGRRFLDDYSRIADPEHGFIEYRVPTYAHAFGMHLSAPSVPCWWEGDPALADVPESRRTLSARRRGVRTHHVLLAWAARGAAIVHPYRRHFPADLTGAAQLLKRGLLGRVRRVLPRGAAHERGR